MWFKLSLVVSTCFLTVISAVVAQESATNVRTQMHQPVVTVRGDVA